MKTHIRKFLNEIKDTSTNNSAAAAAAESHSLRSRDYITTTTNINGNTNSSSAPATITRKPFGATISTADSSMALTVAVLLTVLCSLGFFIVYIHCISSNSDNRRRRRHQILRDRGSASGIDPSIIQSLPLYTYDGNIKETNDCPICLTEFEEKEMIKLIPFCSHFFHPQCIDLWLSAHGTCPLCRSTQLLLPVPLPPKDPSSCFVSMEPEVQQQLQEEVSVPPSIPSIPSSSSSSPPSMAVTRVNSFSSSSRLGDTVHSLPRSNSF
ncbi:hypothetical protein NE237_010650 [Protea cynaroides]|uniref:RING-type E3 ubiquitin transferase n=1 Tax=Protea cynaroides TaxID=273540 RepID=A0A9Q0R1F3_9MAGN|nr:hypothetical protein NE237_010650 [Protea cynaroides]